MSINVHIKKSERELVRWFSGSKCLPPSLMTCFNPKKPCSERRDSTSEIYPLTSRHMPLQNSYPIHMHKNKHKNQIKEIRNK